MTNPANPAAGGYPLGVGQFFNPGGPIKSNVFTQLAFDPRMSGLPLLENSARTATGSEGKFAFSTLKGLAHGFIVQAQTQQTHDGSLYGCAFQFNPSIVSLQHGIDSNATSLTLPQYRRQSADTGVYLIGLASTLNLSLFFDRTYEVNTNPDKGGSYSFYRPLGMVQETKFEGSEILINDDPRIIGVQADINALYRVTGRTSPIPNVTWTNDPVNGTATTSSATITGPMQQVPCYLMLGASLGSASAPYWYGYIDSLAVTYNHFTQAQVPMRAQVDIELTLLPEAVSTPASTATTSSTPAKPNPQPNPMPTPPKQ